MLLLKLLLLEHYKNCDISETITKLQNEPGGWEQAGLQVRRRLLPEESAPQR